MPQSLAWNSASGRPLMVVLVVTILIITISLTSSRQHDEMRKLSSVEKTGDIDEINEIDGFKLSNCGWFRPRKWQELQNAFSCRQSQLRGSFDTATGAERATTSQARAESARDIPIQEFPFYAHLAIKSTYVDLECAGTLVDFEFVVTTAQCAYAATRIFIVLGTSSTQATQGWSTEADRWCIPKSYHPVDNPYPDVAVLRLKVRANYSRAIQPACLSQHMEPSKQALCMVARKRTNQLANQLQGYVVRERKCPANLPELYEPFCYQTNDEKMGFCKLETGTPVVCYDTCDKDSGRVQAFAVGVESFAPTPSDQCDPFMSTPIQYTDLTRKSRLIRSMTHTLINATKYPTPSTIKCVEPTE